MSFRKDRFVMPPSMARHVTNIQDLDPTLFDHSQEEADTSIILYAIDVTQ